MRRTLMQHPIMWLAVMAIGLPVWAGPGHAEGEPELKDLKSFLSEMNRQNPGVRMREEELEASRLRVSSAWLPEDPEFGVDFEGQENPFDFSPRMDDEYMIEQRIAFPAKLWLRRQAAQNKALAAAENLAEEKNEAAWHAREPYYQLKKTVKKKAALEESRKLVERVIASARSRYESGGAAQSEVLAAETEMARIEIEILKAQMEEKLAGAHFAHLVSEPLGTTYRFADEAREPFMVEAVDVLETLAIQKRPHLRSLALEARGAAIARDLERSEWLPDIVGRIEARDYRDGADMEYDTFVGVSVPVWSLLGGVGGTFKAADREANAAALAYDEEVNEVRLKVREAYLAAETAWAVLEIYEKRILPQSRQAVEVALAGYSGGMTGFLEIIEAQKQLKSSLIDSIEAEFEYEKNLSDLKMAVGADRIGLSDKGAQS